jgi:colanic acid biosynthesis glycosyl transferase WcaI
MKVGMITQWYDPETGSAGVPASIARALVARGHELHVITGFPNYPHGRLYPGHTMRWRATEFRDGVTVTRVALYPSHERNALRRMLSYLTFAVSATLFGLSRLRRVDAVLVYSTPATVALPAIVASSLWHIPYLILVQDLWPDTITASGLLPRHLESLTERALHLFCDLAYRRAGAIAVTAPGMVEPIRRRKATRVMPMVIPNWADESVFSLASGREAESVAKPPARFTAMYAGSLGDVQGLDVIIDAAELLLGEPIDIAFVGTGVAEQRLKSAAARRGLTNVRFLGQRPLDQMPELLASGDVQLVTLKDAPLFRLTLPSKVQAALAMGRPVVAAVSGDAAAVLAESGAGRLVEPGDAAGLARALRDVRALAPAERQAMGARGRAFYELRLAERVGAAAISEALEGLL